MKYSPPFIAVILFLIGGISGFIFGKYQTPPFPSFTQDTNSQITRPLHNVAAPITVKYIQSSTLFQGQFAYINGMITKVDNTIATVKTGDKESRFPIASPFTQFKVTSDPIKPHTTTNPKEIELNKQASISLEFRGNEYIITTISIIPPVPTQFVPPVVQPGAGTSIPAVPSTKTPPASVKPS